MRGAIPSYQRIEVPELGQNITSHADFSLHVPDEPIIPFFKGDAAGQDTTPMMIKVADAAVAKACGGAKKIHRMKTCAGEKSTKIYAPDVWLHEESLAAMRAYLVSTEGLLTTPVGAGILSLNGALHQALDLYACLRPGAVPHGRAVSGQAAREYRQDEPRREQRIHLRRHRARGRERQRQKADQVPDRGDGRQEDPVRQHLGQGHQAGVAQRTEPLVRKAHRYAVDNDQPSAAIVHKGNTMKYTEGGFRDWAYPLGAAGIWRRTDRRRPVVLC